MQVSIECPPPKVYSSNFKGMINEFVTHYFNLIGGSSRLLRTFRLGTHQAGVRFYPKVLYVLIEHAHIHVYSCINAILTKYTVSNFRLDQSTYIIYAHVRHYYSDRC